MMINKNVEFEDYEINISDDVLLTNEKFFVTGVASVIDDNLIDFVIDIIYSADKSIANQYYEVVENYLEDNEKFKDYIVEKSRD